MKHLMKVMSLVMILVLVLGMAVSAGSAAEQGKTAQVPLRFICEAKGAEVTWDAAARIAAAKLGGRSLRVWAGSKQAEVNGKYVLLDDEIQMINGRVKAPLSLINDALGTDITVDDYIKILAAKYVDLIGQGAVSDCMLLYSDNMRQAATPEIMGQFGMTFKSLGNVKQPSPAIDKNDVHWSVTAAAIGPYNFIVRFNPEGLIDDCMLMPAAPDMSYKTPEYDKPDTYTEKEVVIGEGEWRLPATLTVPKGKGPFPVLVLVHGSGTNDRDETLGPLKPFRDLAAGLAAQNIAVLRYQKRSLEHNFKFAVVKKLTVKEETVDDAILAVKYLSSVPEVDAARIFVLGHSQGGMLIPRIIKADTGGKVKGAVIMSGNSRPLQDLFVEQYQYLTGLGMATKEQADAIKKQMDMINAPDFSADNPPQGFAMGAPYWWADLKGYSPAEMAKDETTPLLILQGERDYQVTAAADFKGWKDALGTRDDVAFKLYPKLNHMYTEGEGAMSTPVEYYTPANIPAYVIDDIAQWVNAAGK